MAVCLVGLGSNLGDREAHLRTAVDALADHADIAVDRVSRWIESAPVGGPPDQHAFLNGAVRLQTSLPPQQLLAELRRVEQQRGRQRRVRWDARTLDIDLLLYDERIIDTAELQLPHPRMICRRFVLAPAAEVAAEMVYPPLGWTIGRLYRHLDEATNYVALAGACDVETTAVARTVAAAIPVRLILDVGADEAPQPCDAPAAGDRWAHELECADRRARALDRGLWLEQETTALSDFWFDQSLAVCRVAMERCQQDRFTRQWQSMRQRVVAPKLLVWLATPSVAAAPDVPMGQALRQQVLQERGFPVLKVGAESVARAAGEVAAAIQAMQ